MILALLNQIRMFASDYLRDTSRIAAERIEASAPTLRLMVLQAVERAGRDGHTCDELEQILGLRHQTCSARVTELHARGVIIDSGHRRPTRSGRPAIVWVVSPV